MTSSTKVTKTASLFMTKGGPGKTTHCASFGGMAADCGYKVLLINADFQQSLDKYFEITHCSEHGLTQFITGFEDNLDPASYISKTNIHNLDIIRGDAVEEQFHAWLGGARHRIEYLRGAIEALKAKGIYDYIFIDTIGADGTGSLQEMAIRASDVLITPIDVGTLSASEFVKTVDVWRKLIPPKALGENRWTPPPMRCFFNAVKAQPTNSQELVMALLGETIKEFDTPLIQLLKTIVPDRQEIYNRSASMNLPPHREEVVHYKSAEKTSVFDALFSLSCEIFPPLESSTPKWEGITSREMAYIGNWEK